jgi:hypothetical protein
MTVSQTGGGFLYKNNWRVVFCLIILVAAIGIGGLGVLSGFSIDTNQTEAAPDAPDTPDKLALSSSVNGIGWENDSNTPTTVPATAVEGTVIAQGISMDADIEAELSEILIAASRNFTGAGCTMKSYTVQVFDLITDEDLADPRYGGKEYGIKVSVMCEDSMDPLQNTLWAYEIDATRIVQEYYSSPLQDTIGFVAITYKPLESDSSRLVLILDAKDAEKFADLWNSSHYLQKSDWSAVHMYADGIVMFENPDGMLAAPGSGYSNSTEGTTLPGYGKDVLSEKIHEGTSLVTTLINEIGEASEKGDFEEMSQLSEDLIVTCSEIRGEMAPLHVTPEIEPVKEEYLLGIEECRMAGSYLWYGAMFTDADNLQNGRAALEDGLECANNALEMLNMELVNMDMLTMPHSDPFPDAMFLKERYVYLDSKKNNEISLIVDTYFYRNYYVCEIDDVLEKTNAGYGSKFLGVVVEFTHLGYWGTGSSKVKTPAPEDFVLLYDGNQIQDVTPTVMMENIGYPYTQFTLDRKESVESILIFEVPTSFDPHDAYLRVDLGDGGNPVWRLLDGNEVAPDTSYLPGGRPDSAYRASVVFTDRFPGSKEMGVVYAYMDEYRENEISLAVSASSVTDSYVVEKNGISNTIEKEGVRFLMVTVEIDHSGHLGGDNEMIATPHPYYFNLVYEGEDIKDATPSGTIQGFGDAYMQQTLDRMEHTSGVLVFEVPKGFEYGDAYIRVDVPAEHAPLWKLA